MNWNLWEWSDPNFLYCYPFHTLCCTDCLANFYSWSLTVKWHWNLAGHISCTYPWLVVQLVRTPVMNPRSWVHYCVAPFYFVVFKGYGSHLPSQVTFCIMYVTCYKRGLCDGVWKDQSKSMCTVGGISPNACVPGLSQHLLHLRSLLLYVLCSHVLRTLLHSLQQGNDGAFQSGERDSFLITCCHSTTPTVMKVRPLPCSSSPMYGFCVLIEIINTKFLKPRNSRTLGKELCQKLFFLVTYKIIL